MLIVELPEPIRGATHLRLLFLETRYLGDGAEPSEILAAFQPGRSSDGKKFEGDTDLPETISRKIDDVPAFLAWVATHSKDDLSATYGQLFNQRDVMEYLGAEEYRRRGLEAVAASLAELPVVVDQVVTP